MTTRDEGRRTDRGRASATPPTERGDRIAPGLLADPRLTGRGAGAARARLLGQLQRMAGNAGAQRLLASYGVSRAEAEPAGPTAEAAAIVDDTAAEIGPGQMRRTPFLAALRAEVEGVLAGTDPLVHADARASLPATFADLQAQGAAQLERSVRDGLPGVPGGDAQRYIVAAGAAVQARVGASAGPPPGGVVGRVLSAVGGLVSALFKAREGASTPHDARVVRSALGTGQPLDGGVRAHMETAYGRDFSDVSVHADAGAGALSDRMGARAFTVGRDIAFSPGEYQPGNPVGDALIAHELAHVGQQDGGGPSSDAALEDDADRAAVGAVVSQWTGAEGAQHVDGALPRLRAGLRLQRCAGAKTPAQAPGGGTACASLTPDQWREAVVKARGLGGEQGAAAMTALAQQAVCELGITVRAAGTSHPDKVDPADYAEVPVLTFDARLNQKSRWKQAHREQETAVGSNVGYNFHVGAKGYAAIGPSSLNENTPLTTRQYAQHELALVAMPENGRSNDDLELLTWTDDFRGYFHQYLSLKLEQRPTWDPLIDYYGRPKTDETVKKQALQRLVDYYTNPPAGVDAALVRRQIKKWLHRRSGQLVTDLSGALPAGP